MTNIVLPYGNTVQQAEIRTGIDVRVIDKAAAVPEDLDLEALLEESMEDPTGSERLEDMVRKEDTVCIVFNDQTRPGPNQMIMKSIAKRLDAAGVPDDQVTIIFATGSHRVPTDKEKIAIIGEEAFRRYRTISHDCQDEDQLAFIGNTKTSNVPVYVNKAVAEASFVITTGLIAPHHCAGYSGGRKSIVPGVAGLQTLKIHHSFPVYQYEPAMGYMYGNPFHIIAVEAARMVNVRFIINAVQDPHKNFFAFVAGDLEKAHEKGADLCRDVCSVSIDRLDPVVIVSPGGAPRDIDLYQSQKALSVAEKVCSEHCTFILCAECKSGFGESGFYEWMTSRDTPEEIIERYAEEGFVVGSNKAFNYARALVKGRVIIVSDLLDPQKVRDMKLEWAPDLQTAVDMALEKTDPEHITVIPNAVNYVIEYTGENTGE